MVRTQIFQSRSVWSHAHYGGLIAILISTVLDILVDKLAVGVSLHGLPCAYIRGELGDMCVASDNSTRQ